jgi:septal ring-binding cell division protein DamX
MPGRRSSGFGTMLVLIGLLAVLGTAFGAGFLAGQRWSFPSSGKGGDDKRALSGSGSGRGGTEESPPIPAITFYRELTAPTPEATKPRADAAKRSPAPTPAAPRASRDGSRAGTDPARDASSSAPRDRPVATASSAARDRTAELASAASSSYTVQVAAYRNRSQAEALKETLAARGLEAEVSEAVTSAGTRYRVRLGRYPNRSAAQEAATRVAQHARMSTYVAPR